MIEVRTAGHPDTTHNHHWPEVTEAGDWTRVARAQEKHRRHHDRTVGARQGVHSKPGARQVDQGHLSGRRPALHVRPVPDLTGRRRVNGRVVHPQEVQGSQ